jgi:hypothetical protein
VFLPIIMNVMQADRQQNADVQVVEAVEDHSTCAAAFDQPQLAQLAQMLRDSGFGDASDRRQVARAKLLPQQREYDTDACRVGQRAECLGQRDLRARIWQERTPTSGTRWVGPWRQTRLGRSYSIIRRLDTAGHGATPLCHLVAPSTP